MKRKLEVATAVVTVSGVFGAVAAAATSPAVVTGGTSSVGQHGVLLHGSVNPNGSSTTYFFQWGLTNAYGVDGKPHSAGSTTKAVAVQQTAGGLIPGTTYHYRLVATNQSGTSEGADRTFKTSGHPPPGVVTGPAAQVNATGATLAGTVNPAGQATSWYFQWGATTGYGQQTAAHTLSASASADSVTSSLQGLLAPGTIYHYRLVATHPGSATSIGSDGSFMTYPSPRPVPRVSANTRPRHPRRRPYVLTTIGSVIGPSWVPARYACAGNVTIRFFRGLRQVGFTLAGLQPNCKFSAATMFPRLPGRGNAHRPVRLRIVVRFVSTPYLATNRARLERVALG